MLTAPKKIKKYKLNWDSKINAYNIVTYWGLIIIKEVFHNLR